jgi:uncharacterized protein (DUF302 family)
MTQTAYGFGTTTRLPYDETVARVRALLQEEGFGVLTEIDVKKTMKQKLDADFRRYVILGACNPRLAHRAFQAELEIGLLLPCNVVVYEEGDHSVVSVMDPLAALRIVGNDTLQPIAREARIALERVVKRVSAT